MTVVLTAAVVLGLATLLLLTVGRHLRFSSRLLAIMVATGVSYAGAELAVWVWNLVPSYALFGAGLTLFAGALAALALPHWNPVGQVFLGSFAAAALAYLTLAAYLTFGGDLSWAGMIASVVLLIFESLALLLAGYFAFEGCDILCRTRSTRAITPPDPTHTPRVSLQVAAFNEPADMLLETVKSLERIDYPNYEIVVVDNNTPSEDTWRPVAEYCEGRPNVRFLHVETEGFKAGALNRVLAEHLGSEVDIVGIVDADYQVDPGYLKRAIGYFADPGIAFVQTPQDYREYEGDTYLTACYDAYKYFFRTSMPSRNQRNSIIFAGTMGLIRRSALEEVGGWPEWCITEDAETSLRILKAGYEGVYIDESLGHGIMPLTFAAFKSQRFRWCFGGIQIFRRYFRNLLPLPRSARNRLSLQQRVDYLFGSGLVWFNDVLYLGFTLVLLVTGYLILNGQEVHFRPLIGSLVVLPAALIASGVLRAQWSLRNTTGIGIGRASLAFLNWLSTSWTTAMATLQALVRSQIVFMRTPKEREGQSLWTALRDARVETALALLLWTVGITVALSERGTAFLMLLFAWQGTVYGSSLLMSWLNVRTELTPKLERRRRTEYLRERAAALMPYYVGASAGLVAIAIVTAVLLMGGSQPGRPPQDALEVPRSSERATVAEIITQRDGIDAGDTDAPTTEEDRRGETDATPTGQETPAEDESPTPAASPAGSPEESPSP